MWVEFDRFTTGQGDENAMSSIIRLGCEYILVVVVDSEEEEEVGVGPEEDGGEAWRSWECVVTPQGRV